MPRKIIAFLTFGFFLYLACGTAQVVEKRENEIVVRNSRGYFPSDPDSDKRAAQVEQDREKSRQEALETARAEFKADVEEVLKPDCHSRDTGIVLNASDSCGSGDLGLVYKIFT